MLAAGATGESNKETARRLFLAEDTVKAHWKKVFSKLGARNRTHAVALGYQQRLLRTEPPPPPPPPGQIGEGTVLSHPSTGLTVRVLHVYQQALAARVVVLDVQTGQPTATEVELPLQMLARWRPV